MNLLEKLVERLEEGNKIPLKHSLLIASGIEDKKHGNKYLKKFDEIKINYEKFEKENRHRNPDELTKAKLISEYLTKPLRYKKDKFLFYEIIDARLSKNPFSGHGNCVGLTSLYNALAEEEGVNTGIYKKRDHILTRVISSQKEYAIENTSQNGFGIELNGSVGKSNNLELISDILSSREFKDYKEKIITLNHAKRIAPRNSIIYINSAIYYYNLQKIKNSLEEINNAIKIDPFNPQSYELRSQIKKHLKDKKGAKEDARESKELKKYNKELDFPNFTFK